MADNASYNLPYRRKREGKTDYKKRRSLVVSGMPRLVSRPSNKNMVVQVVEAKLKGDRVLTSAYSKELATKYGWRGCRGNIPTAYLTGLLAGYRSTRKKIKKAILDIGLRRASPGSRVFASLKGALDAGMNIPYGEDILPNEDRLSGGHIVAHATELSKQPEAYRRFFSKYIDNKLKPEELPSHFEEVKGRIKEEFEK